MESKLDITEVLRKAMLLGIGAISLTKEKAEELIQELTQKGEVSQKEAREFVNRMMEKGEEEEGEFRQMLSREVGKLMSEMPLVSRKEYEALAERVALLESKLAEKDPIF